MNKQKNNVLIIPAAGRGVRFNELGKNYPKCVLPVDGKPIIAKAIEMLAERPDSPYTHVVIGCADKESKEAIQAAIEPYNFKTPVDIVQVVLESGVTSASPAYSLHVCVRRACELSPDGTGITVFLSDMLPAHEKVVDKIYKMPTDSWGVVEVEDFERWCMVTDTAFGLQFYDKPKEKPPTTRAACGVYKYSDAFRLVMEFYTANKAVRDRELQFSDVAKLYNGYHPLRVQSFFDRDFKDYGTLQEYLKNKGINKCRSFNRILETRDFVIKESDDYSKIRDECTWMQNAPMRIQKYLPRVVDADLMLGKMRMEKIRSSNLRDVALYLDRSYDSWKEIFQSVDEYMEASDATSIPYATNDKFWDDVEVKTRKRLNSLQLSNYAWFERSNSLQALDWFDNDFSDAISSLKSFGDEDPVMYYHGDLHFANMFYCFHYKDLKLVDPRGEMRGSKYYDLAKLCHSVFGRYDYIDSDLYRNEGMHHFFYDKNHKNIEQAFMDVIFNKLTKHEKYLVLVLTASLFLSMIPLHSDRPEHCELFFREFKRFVNISRDMVRKN